MKSFQDQVAIVTGAGQGIGLEICRQLVRAGAKVVLNDIDEILTAKAAASISADQTICLPLVGDASNLEFIRRMVSETVRRFGRLDIAIANAGITLFGSFFEYKPEDFSTLLNLNLGGSFFF